MRKRLIGFRHAVHVFLLLDGGAAIIGGIEQLVRELVGHAFLATAAGVSDQPADRQRRAPVGIDFDRHLVVGATYAASLHFQQRLRVFDGLLEQLQGLVAALRLQLGKRFVEDALGGRLLALPHHRVHKFGHQVRSVNWIGGNAALCNMSFTRHVAINSVLSASSESQRSTINGQRLPLRLLRSLRSVLRAPLVATGNAHRIQCSAHHVIAHTRQILHAAPANQHDRVLLQVVPNAGNISRDFNTIGEAHARHLPQRRVGLFGSLGIYAGADAALLRTGLQGRTRRLVTRLLAAGSHQLIESRHSLALLNSTLARRTPPTTRTRAPALLLRFPAGANCPAIILAAHHTAGEKTLGFPIRLTPTTVAPSPTSEVLRFVSFAPHSLPTGERSARSISARKLPDLVR